jgi:hypothetical protein
LIVSGLVGEPTAPVMGIAGATNMRQRRDLERKN